MAKISYPKGQGGKFVGLANISVTSVQLQVANALFDTTGTDENGDAELFKHFCDGLATIDIVTQGTVRVTEEGASVCAKAQLGIANAGDYEIKLSKWSLARVWPLFDVTGSGDSEKAWEWGLPRLEGRAEGLTLATGPIYNRVRTELDLDINLVGEIEGTAAVQMFNLGLLINRGGPIPVGFSYVYDGPWTFDPVEDYFDAVLDPDENNPVRTELTIGLDSGQTITRTAILYSIEFSNNNESGGPVYVTCRWRVDQPDPEPPPEE